VGETPRTATERKARKDIALVRLRPRGQGKSPQPVWLGLHNNEGQDDAQEARKPQDVSIGAEFDVGCGQLIGSWTITLHETEPS
jgi:hypothetical protein